MSISKFVFIVSMNVKKEYEDLFNEVYDEEHVPHLLNVPGVNKVTRGKGIPFNFSIGGETKSMDSPNQKFVAMYEIDNSEVINSTMNEHYEKYTNTLQLDHECNYLDPEKTSSNNFIV